MAIQSSITGRSWWTHSLSTRWWIGLGHLGFLVLLIFSQVFFRERMLHFDTANYAFNLIWFGKPYIQHDRWIGWLSQVPVLAFIKGGASIETVLRVYSLVLMALPYLIFLVLVYLFRSPRGGLLLLLVQLLTIRYKFYAPVAEVVQSLTWVALALGWLMRDPGRWPVASHWNILVAYVLAIPLLITHPFGLLSFGLGYLIWLSADGHWRSQSAWLVPALALIGFVLLRLLGGQSFSGYETGRLTVVREYASQLSDLPSLYVWERFWWYLQAHYPLTIVLFAGLFLVALSQKKIALALTAVVVFSVIALLAMLTHAYLNGPVYLMIDGYFAHLGLPIALLLVLALPKEPRPVTLLVLGILVIFSLHRIASVHTFFEKREALITGIMDQQSTPDQPKLMASMEGWDWSRLWVPWAVGMESLLMSTLDHPDTPQTIYFLQEGESLDYALRQKGHYIGQQGRPERYKYEERPPVFEALSPAPYRRVYVNGTY